MQHRRLYIAAGIIALILIASFVLTVPHTRDVSVAHEAAATATTTPVVSVDDSYAKGTHTITGSVTAPDACTFATATASVIGTASTSESIALAISTPLDAGTCLDVPTATDFSATVAAPAGVPITVTVNGVAASSTSS